MWTFCCLKKAKNQQPSFFCWSPRGSGGIFIKKIFFLERKRVRIANEKCVAHSVTQLVVNEIHKNWKNKASCAPLRLVMVAERARGCGLNATWSKFVGSWLTFETWVRGCGLGEEKLSSCLFTVYPSAV